MKKSCTLINLSYNYVLYEMNIKMKIPIIFCRAGTRATERSPVRGHYTML